MAPKIQPTSLGLDSCVFKIHYNIILPSATRSSCERFPRIEICRIFFIHPLCPTVHIHFIHFDSMSVMIFDNLYNLLCVMLCTFHKTSITSCLLKPDILPERLCYVVRVRDQFSHLYKISSNCIVLYAVNFACYVDMREEARSV
jgi:hypothetical protein